jgi:alkylation response protein AidB-like acyl-CoA dehydrogenase
VALHRRDTADLVAEELRRLEPDEVYAETLRALAQGGLGGRVVPPEAGGSPGGSSPRGQE